jgi:hypothetical protein
MKIKNEQISKNQNEFNISERRFRLDILVNLLFGILAGGYLNEFFRDLLEFNASISITRLIAVVMIFINVFITFIFTISAIIKKRG